MLEQGPGRTCSPLERIPCILFTLTVCFVGLRAPVEEGFYVKDSVFRGIWGIGQKGVVMGLRGKVLVVGGCYSLAVAGNKSAMRPPLPLLGCGGEWKETGRNWWVGIRAV